MSIVTRGLGGKSLITRGYGFLEWLKKIVKEVIRRLLPRKRIRFKTYIPVKGYPVFPFKGYIPARGDLAIPVKQSIAITGEKDFRPILFILLDEEDEE